MIKPHKRKIIILIRRLFTISPLLLVQCFLATPTSPVCHATSQNRENSPRQSDVYAKKCIGMANKTKFFLNSYRLPRSERNRRWLPADRSGPRYSHLPASMYLFAHDKPFCVAVKRYRALSARIRHRSANSSLLRIRFSGILILPLHAAAIFDQPPQAK